MELVGCFWLSIADHVPMIPEAGEEFIGGSGSNQAITLGGVDRQGRDAVNDLTYVMLRATGILKLRDPNVNARYHYEVNPPEYLERLCQVNMNTWATPCFHNDVAVIQTLQETYKAQKISLEDARDYGVVGCVEPISAGRTHGHTGAIFIVLTAALEMALFGGKHRLTGDEQIGARTTPLEYLNSYADFQKALETQIDWLILQAVTFNNYAGITHQKIHRTPMLSALMEGCLKNGKDVICGGATYKFSGSHHHRPGGGGGLGDGHSGICLRQGGMSAGDMIAALQANWEDPYAKFQARIKHSPEKFGRESALARDNADWLLRFIHDNFVGRQNYRGGKYNVGYWTMTMHAGFGMITGALPNGREQGRTSPAASLPSPVRPPQLPPASTLWVGWTICRSPTARP